MVAEQRDSLRDELHGDVEELERQFRKDPSPEIYIPLGKIYLRRGDPFNAISIAEKGIKKDNSLDGHLLLAQAYFDASAIKRNFIKKAAQEVEHILRQHPNSWQAHRIKGEIALEEDNLQEALTALKQSNRLNPNHPQARMLLKSLGVELSESPTPKEGPFHIEVETGFIPPNKDSLLKTLRDIFIVLVIAFIGISWMADQSIQEKRIHALIFLGRTQQNLDTYTGLNNAVQIYNTIREKFDADHPFAILHLAETYFNLWDKQKRDPQYIKNFENYFEILQRTGSKVLLNTLTEYHSLVALVEYYKAQQLLEKGEHKLANDRLRQIESYLSQRETELSPHERFPWIRAQIYEALGQPRHARANYRTAAELSLYNPMYNWRLGYFHLRQREFAAAHMQFTKTEEQAKQNVVLVKGTLSATERQKNEYCWIDPHHLFGNSAPPGLELGTFDLLSESLSAAFRSDQLSNCPFHNVIQERYKANSYYLLAPIQAALSVLDSGVGMNVGYEMVKALDTQFAEVRKLGDLSPYIEAWYLYVQAKSMYYQNNFDKALELVIKAEQLAPYVSYIQSLYGLVLIKTQKWEEAMSHLDKAFKVDPLLLQPYYEGAEALLGVVDKEGKSTQNERVAHILEAMKKVFGEHSDYLYLAGRHAINSGDQKTAEKFWLQALDSSKAPYFGEHYESNLEMGKLSMRAARNIHRERKFAIADYSDLLDQFNKKIDKINKKLDDRLVKKEDNEKAKAEYKQFLRMLEDKKRIDPKIFDVKIADLREAYYEEAGGYFEQAMQMRPGAVEARLWTGMIYYENGSWTDSTGHFTISAKGYLRDHDYKNSSRAYSLLANAIANQVFEDENKQLQKTPQKRLEAADKVVAFFNREVEMALREPYIQMLANKQKTIPPETTRHLVQTVQLLAKVLEDVKDINTKDAVSKIQEEAEFLQKQGLMAWGQRMQERAKAQADAPPSKPPRKTPRRRRR